MTDVHDVTELPQDLSTRRKIQRGVSFTVAGVVALLLVTEGVKKIRSKSETVEEPSA